MFEKYNEKARRALFFARYEASKLGSKVIESEHVLLGVLREGEEIIKEIFSRFNVKADDVRREIEGDRIFVERVSSTQELPLSEESKKILAYASHEAESMMHPYVGTEHLLIGILRVEGSVAARILAAAGFNLYGVREETIGLIKEREASKQKKELPFLAEYARDLTALAQQGSFDPLVGRDEEVERIVQILSRRTKNNPILLGEPGVGKTAIVEGLAQRIVEGSVPLFLAQRKILALDLSLIVAGTKYRGQFEERLKGILKELKENQDLIVFIDELHSLIGAGSAEGSLDAANILKPALSRGEISCIGATTLKEYRKYIEKDRSLLRRFQAITVAPPDEEETLKILEGVQERYEKFHRVRYSKEAVKTAVYQASRYIPDRFFPDKAIDLLDEAGAKVKLRMTADTQVLRRLENDVKQVVKEMKKAITEKDFERAVFLREREIEVKDEIERTKAIASEESSYVEVARRLAEFLFDNPKAMVRFDMSEFMEKHAVSKLIGSPPGYVGHDEGGQLTERIRRNPYSLLLLDEIEKAHPDIANLLLQILEDGQLTDAYGNVVDFKNTLIIMTSNIGTKFIVNQTRVGFGDAKNAPAAREVEEMVLKELRREFSPEFTNRIDDVIVFNALGVEELRGICRLLLDDVAATLKHRGLKLEADDKAVDWLLATAGNDVHSGARPLRRTIQRWVEDAVSEILITSREALEHLDVTVVDGQIRVFARSAETVGPGR